MTRDAKADLRAINTILWRDWDPIGCGVPEDEYESYAPGLYRLLVENAPREALQAYLVTTAREMMSASVPDTRLSATLDKLMALNIARSPA